jgi:hypothetical protein
MLTLHWQDSPVAYHGLRRRQGRRAILSSM